MPLDPQVEALLHQMREAGAKPFEELSVPEARVAALAFADLQGEPEAVASVEHRFIPGPTADLPVRIYTPEGDGPRAGLVYFHGSGWVVLNIEVCDTTMRALANSTGCVVVAVNYQKAPEHPFPVPFEDCWADHAVDVRERGGARHRPRADRRDRRQRGRQPRRRRDAARPRRGRAARSPSRR